MADPKNQHQKPDGSGNPKEEKTTSGTGALDDAIRSTKERATGAEESAPRGQGASSGAKKPKAGDIVTTASVVHDGKTHPPGTPVKSMGMNKQQQDDLKKRGHTAAYQPPEDATADEDDGDEDDE